MDTTRSFVVSTLFLLTQAHGAFAKTTWVLAYSKPGQDNGIYALSAVDAKHGWALGVDSSMGNSTPVALRTTDGVSWAPMDLPSSGGGGTMDLTLFLLVSFSDAQTGWLFGNKVSFGGAQPLLYLSPDGGTSWEQTAAPSVTLADMQALPGGHLVGVGESTVFLTDASGNSQEVPVDLPSGHSLSALFMLNDHCGYALALPEKGDKGVLLWTQDGGQSWQTRNPLLSLRPNRVWFVDGQTGWMAGSRDSVGLIAWTQDGGQTWQPVSVPDHPPVLGNDTVPMTDCPAVRFFDDQRGVAVCVACTADCDSQDENAKPSYITGIYWTADGGRSWTLDPDYESVMTDPRFGEMLKYSGLFVAAFPDPNHGLVAGQNAILLRYVADDPEEPGWTEFPCEPGGNEGGDGGIGPHEDCDGADCAGGNGASGAMRLSGCGCRSGSTPPGSIPLLFLLFLSAWRTRRNHGS